MNLFAGLTGQNKELAQTITLLQPFVALAKNFTRGASAMEEALHKLLYTISTVTSFLLQRGFCLPAELADEILEQEGAEIGGGGAGAGEAGENDVSEQFDKEDLEDPLEGDEASDAKNQPKGEEEDQESVQLILALKLSFFLVVFF